MKDEKKTKDQLLKELRELRQRTAELEKGETEHKRMEETLRTAAQEWRTTFDAIGHPLFLLDAEGRVLRCNTAGTQLLGKPFDEIIGRLCYELMPDTMEPVTRMKETSLRETMVLPMGDRWFDVTADPLLGDHGKLAGGVCVMADITERKRAEEALDADRRRLFSVLDALPGLVYLQAPDYSIRFANRRFRERHGEPDEKLCYELLHERQKPCEECPTFRLFDTGEPQVSEWVDPAQGRTYQVYDYPFTDVDGSPLVLDLAIDITQRKQAEEALQRLMAFNESIVLKMGEGILVTDAQGQIAFTNAAADALLGYEPEQLVGQHWTLIAPADQQPIVEAADERRARGESDRYELELLGKDGIRIPVLVSGSPRSEQGHLAGTLAVFTDIAERKRAEEALLRSEGEARKRLEEQITLREAIAVISSTLDLPSVLTRIAEQMCLSVDSTSAYICGLEAETMESTVLADYYGPEACPEERVSDLGETYQDIDAPFMAALQARRHDIAHVDDPELPVADRAHLRQYGARSVLYIPLWMREQLIGYAELWESRRRREFTPEEIAVCQGIAQNAAIAIANARLYEAAQQELAERRRAEEALRESYDRLGRTLGRTVRALALMAETRDPYTAGHQERVKGLATAIAEEMGLSEEQIDSIRVAATVHDIGKMYVPAEILSKPTKLSEVEWSLIKTHPQVGYDILETVEFTSPVAQIVLQHQERMDGSGYPSGLSGDEILLEARILAAADVVEAMASDRPYRPAHGIGEALEELRRHSGTLFDPRVVDACLKLFEEKDFRFG